MKRLITVALTMLVTMSLVPSAAAGRKRPQQKIDGSVMLPTPTEGNVCFSGLHRRLRVGSQMAFPNGVVGFDFDVDPKTAGQRFKLELTGGSGDLDINFYKDLGTVDGGAEAVSFEVREPGGETGVVPPGYPKVIICSYEGANLSFTYTTLGK